MPSLIAHSTPAHHGHSLAQRLARLASDIMYVFEVHERIHYDQPWLRSVDRDR